MREVGSKKKGKKRRKERERGIPMYLFQLINKKGTITPLFMRALMKKKNRNETKEPGG